MPVLFFIPVCPPSSSWQCQDFNRFCCSQIFLEHTLAPQELTISDMNTEHLQPLAIRGVWGGVRRSDFPTDQETDCGEDQQCCLEVSHCIIVFLSPVRISRAYQFDIYNISLDIGLCSSCSSLSWDVSFVHVWKSLETDGTWTLPVSSPQIAFNE